MICGGHATRAHRKQLEKLSKMKRFSPELVKKYRKIFPSVVDAVCCCSRHKQGCGCLSDRFVERAGINFSTILSGSSSDEEFSTRMKGLARHARDEHEWGSGRCDFHLIRVCSCNKCDDGEDLQCEGKDYHTRYPLSCPFHSLAYEIECHERAEMAKQLVHPVLKRGHSNWLEASHNVFIRFRPKHIHLERLHYVLSTELALLQSNMTYMYEKRGPQYHWVIELFRRMKLPVFDGIQAALETFNKQRKRGLDRKKMVEYKQRRIRLRVQRMKDEQVRKEWSKKHGHNTYGDDDSDVELKPKGRERQKKRKAATGGKCSACGSTSHRSSRHRDCPFNKRAQGADDDKASENSDVVQLSDDPLSDVHVAEGSSELGVPSSDSDWCFEDDIISGSLCTCGAYCRAHKKDCPLSSRNRYAGRTLFPKVSSVDPGTDLSCKPMEPEASDSGDGSVQLGKRERLSTDKPPLVKRTKIRNW